jgi:hypothetical protein
VAQGAGFDEKVVKYVKDYIAGINRDTSLTTMSLGKVLLPSAIGNATGVVHKQ